MKVSDEDLNSVRMLYCEEGAHDEDTRVAAMYEELMALRKVARAAWLMRAFERYTGRCVVHDDSYEELKSALKEAGYDV